MILHGLFGSSRNWAAIAERLSRHFSVYTVDLRNHGDSPHASEHTMEAMAGDLNEFFLVRRLRRPVLLGHSMGGMLATYFALQNPLRVRGLVVVDILPMVYPIRFEREFAALKKDISHLKSYNEIEAFLNLEIGRTEVARFLAMNLERPAFGEGGYYWRINIDALERFVQREVLPDWLDINRVDTWSAQRYPEPVQFIFGDRSPFYLPEKIPLLDHLFSHWQVDVVRDGTHWLHVSQKESFLDSLQSFLLQFKVGWE